jgi:hypothetical protein
MSINQIYANILKYYRANTRDYNYVAIGSAPHLTFDKLDDRWDQMIPKFLVDIINTTDLTIRIILIDPEFSKKNMVEYFNSNRWTLDIPLEFENVPQKYIFLDTDEILNNLQIWRTTDHRIEVLIVSDSFYHINRWNERTDDWFLKSISELTISCRNKLVVQEYTGHELDDLRRELYSTSSNKDLFKKHVLVDMTYGEDCHCGTDLTKYAPYYDKNFDFINISMLNEHEYIDLYGMNEKIDTLIKNYFLKKFRKIINDNHSNYRLAVKGSPIHPTLNYPTNATADQIMGFIKYELEKVIKILANFHIITPDKIKKIQHLLTHYEEIDMYAWPSTINGVI